NHPVHVTAARLRICLNRMATAGRRPVTGNVSRVWCNDPCGTVASSGSTQGLTATDSKKGTIEEQSTMDTNQPSRSAMSTAVARATHRLWAEPPWIFDDPFALILVGAGWENFAAASRGLARSPVVRQGHAGVLVRSRYPEDRLTEGQYSQYVILGAGLDSFAWRRPDLRGSLRVFEVDHPATQAWKHERIATLALPISEGHVFVPVDFE